MNFISLTDIDSDIVKALQKFFSQIGWNDFNLQKYKISWMGSNDHLQFYLNNKFLVIFISKCDGPIKQIEFCPNWTQDGLRNKFISVYNNETHASCDIFVDKENKLMILPSTCIMLDLS